MQKRELQQRLITEEIPKNWYWLNGGFPNEALCLNIQGGLWEVYYSEKGLKTSLKQFESEEDACEYFYNLIKVYKERQSKYRK